MRRKSQLGFGLGLHSFWSDMLVPLVIIAILALFAVSSYGTYKTRGSIEEGLAAMSTVRAAVEKVFRSGGPADIAAALPAGWAPKEAEQVRLVAVAHDGTITLRFAENVAPDGENIVQIAPFSDGKPLDLSRRESAGRSFEWKCGVGKTTVPEDLRPDNCR